MTKDTYTTLTDPSAGGNPAVTIAQAINDAGINDTGRIVGYFFDGNGRYHGFLYNNGTYTTLNDPSASSSTFAYGISDTGQIVGKYEDSSGYHGFLYGNGVYTTLDDPLATQGGT